MHCYFRLLAGESAKFWAVSQSDECTITRWWQHCESMEEERSDFQSACLPDRICQIYIGKNLQNSDNVYTTIQMFGSRDQHFFKEIYTFI